MQHRQKIITALGDARMSPFLDETKGNLKHALHLYLWHSKISGQLQSLLGITEVILRNALDRKLQKWNQTHKQNATSWILEPPASPLRSLSKRKRETAIHLAHIKTGGKNIDHNTVLSCLTFGIWKDLLPNHAPNATESETNRNRLILWREATSHAFPYAKHTDGKDIYWHIARLHELRNRVSHMDSLLRVDITARIQDALDLLNAIDPELKKWVIYNFLTELIETLKAKP